jgi:aconitate hydratase
MNDPLGAVTTFEIAPGKSGKLVSLPALEKKGFGKISRLPVSIRIVLESLARNVDGKRVHEEDVRALAGWQPRAERTREVPFVVARVLLQDFTGVPLIVDLAAMRAAVGRLGKDPMIVEPLVPVDLVIDHSVQMDAFGTGDALKKNMDLEFERNAARYEFLKWGTSAFKKLRIVPPGIGICHQVNLEYLAHGVLEQGGVYYPDTLVGTDSHTPMVNGLGLVAWGVGGIEAEAAMLGQPNYFLTPDVVGVNLTGALRPGVTGTDLVLRITELMRKAKVVGKFVEFFGEGAASLPVPERATISNMSPEYGATMGYFPPDEKSVLYLKQTGRPPEVVAAFEAYFRAQGMFGIPRAGEVDYSEVHSLDLSTVVPAVAGPKRPQDRIELTRLGSAFKELFSRKDATGYGKPAEELGKRWAGGAKADVGHGDVLIAAITSCTNTSNPGVMLAAGLLAKKAVEKGLQVKPNVKTTLAPGSRVVSAYLEKTGLQRSLDALGFNVAGYGCATCIGNSGPLDEKVEKLVTEHDVVAASVLSGNRNFEARVHQNIKANFLMSPPLVVAFAIAGRVDLDLEKEPLGTGKDGKPVFLADVWPSPAEIDAVRSAAEDAESFRKNYYSGDLGDARWNALPAPKGKLYEWNPKSDYIQEAPFFTPFGMAPGKIGEIRGAKPLAIFGDSVTTDHISPAGNIKASSPAGLYLQSLGVKPVDFNSYGARRGNDKVMVRGTFANVRIKNLMVPGVEGGVTVHRPSGKQLPIFDAAELYQKEGVPTAIIAGQEYGTGSSRDWAAKGPALQGVKLVVARSFERIHRSNLVGMGILPCQFAEGTTAQTLGLDGTEVFDLTGIGENMTPRQQATLVIHRKDGKTETVPVTVRIDTPIEVEYFRHGGITQYVLRQIVARS